MGSARVRLSVTADETPQLVGRGESGSAGVQRACGCQSRRRSPLGPRALTISLLRRRKGDVEQRRLSPLSLDPCWTESSHRACSSPVSFRRGRERHCAPLRTDAGGGGNHFATLAVTLGAAPSQTTTCYWLLPRPLASRLPLQHHSSPSPAVQLLLKSSRDAVVTAAAAAAVASLNCGRCRYGIG